VDPDKLVPAPRPSKVTVVGGGPGGLEAARVAALRGHEVTLVEARDKVGGALALWASLPGREFFMKSIEWWNASSFGWASGSVSAPKPRPTSSLPESRTP